MKMYKYTIIIGAALTIVAFVISITLNYCFIEVGYWINICLGIFGSGLLTLISSIVGYKVERRRAMERFWQNVHSFLKVIARYKRIQIFERKIQFILDIFEHDNINYIELGNNFAEISFIFTHKKNSRMIGEKIYKPIHDLHLKIGEYANLLSDYNETPRFYKDINEIDIDETLKDIKSEEEVKMLLDKVNNIPDIDEEYFQKSVEPIILVFPSKEILDVLYESYYKLVYGKRQYKRVKNQQSKRG